jgi:hypothetical protein
MASLSDVLPIFPAELLPIGAAVRLCRVSTDCRRVLAQDASVWAGYCRYMGLVRTRSREVLTEFIHDTRHCRECGSRRVPRHGVCICSTCARDPDGFCSLVDAHFIKHRMREGGWPLRPERIIAHLRIVRRTHPNQMRLFWRHEVLALLSELQLPRGV